MIFIPVVLREGRVEIEKLRDCLCISWSKSNLPDINAKQGNFLKH